MIMRATVAFVLLMPALAAAQSSSASQGASTPADSFGDLPIPSWGYPILDTFNKPVHPIVGGVAAGGGLGIGVGYTSPDDQRIFKSAEAMITVRRYWSLAGEVGRRSLSDRSRIGVFATMRDMNRLDYFGLGPNTSFDDRTAFRLREQAFGTQGWYRVTPGIRVGGSASMYFPDLGSGEHSSVPSIELLYTETTAPGISAQPAFGRYRAFTEFFFPAPADFTTPDDPGTYRGAYQLAFESNRDHDTGRHDFHRWEAEVQQRIPGLRTGHRLTLHGFLSSINTNADVPYYMLYTLGGSGGLKSFRPDLLGLYDTRATLRAFKNYRFRDRDLVLLQAEYHLPIYRRVQASVFVDSGQVAPRTAELFKDIRTTTGFSVSYVRRNRPLGRVDVGFGGGEGWQVFWSFGGFQN
jgi:hypothetical protein